MFSNYDNVDLGHICSFCHQSNCTSLECTRKEKQRKRRLKLDVKKRLGGPDKLEQETFYASQRALNSSAARVRKRVH